MSCLRPNPIQKVATGARTRSAFECARVLTHEDDGVWRADVGVAGGPSNQDSRKPTRLIVFMISVGSPEGADRRFIQRVNIQSR